MLATGATEAANKYTDENAVAFAVKDAGFDPYEKKVKGITAMTSELGKKKFEEILHDSLIEYIKNYQ